MKPMLAAKLTDPSKLTYPLLASPKLDGVRALVIDGVVVSRKLLPIPNKHVQKCFGRNMYNGLDGELIVGLATDPSCYRDTTSGVMSVDGRPDVSFNVFDDFTRPKNAFGLGPFHERLYRARVRVKQAGNPNLNLVAHERLTNYEEVEEYEQRMIYHGYEGAMLRSWMGVYKQGRSTEREGFLLKLKRFEDSEARVIGYEELEHNNNVATRDALGHTKRSSFKIGRVKGGLLGALVVQPKHGVSFSIGSGFTAEDRRFLWIARETLKGKIVKYRFFPGGSKERPRFPTYLGFRSKLDV